MERRVQVRAEDQGCECDWRVDLHVVGNQQRGVSRPEGLDEDICTERKTVACGHRRHQGHPKHCGKTRRPDAKDEGKGVQGLARYRRALRKRSKHLLQLIRTASLIHKLS